MGVWLNCTGRIELMPPADDSLICEYLCFEKRTCPEDYYEREKFSNTWFFDEDNNLISHAGKFAEPLVWFRHIKENFFDPKGIKLIGVPGVIGEGDKCFWEFCSQRDKEYDKWKPRKEEYIEQMRPFSPLFHDD